MRELLARRGESSTLVVVEGHAQVVTTEELKSDRYAGALDVMSGEELARRVETDSPTEQDVDALAAALNTMVSKLGA